MKRRYADGLWVYFCLFCEDEYGKWNGDLPPDFEYIFGFIFVKMNMWRKRQYAIGLWVYFGFIFRNEYGKWNGICRRTLNIILRIFIWYEYGKKDVYMVNEIAICRRSLRIFLFVFIDMNMMNETATRRQTLSIILCIEVTICPREHTVEEYGRWKIFFMMIWNEYDNFVFDLEYLCFFY